MKLKKYFVALLFFAVAITLLVFVSNKKTNLVANSGMKNDGNNTINVTGLQEYAEGMTDVEKQNIASSNTSIIQSALGQAKGHDSDGVITVVNIPAGTYHINNTLYVFSNTKLHLENDTTIINDDGGVKTLRAVYWDDSNSDDKLCILENCNIGGYEQWHDITIEGGIWDLNSLESQDADGFRFSHGHNLIIQNTTIKNGAANAVNVSGTSDATIDTVIFKDQKTSRYEGSSEYLYLSTTNESENKGNYPYDNTPVKNVIIQNCTFNNVYVGLGMHIYNEASNNDGDNIRIINNTFTNIKTYGMNLFDFTNIEVRENTATGATGSYAFIQTNDSSGSVTANTVSGFEKKLVKNANVSNRTLTTDINESEITNKYYTVNFKCGADYCDGSMNSENFIYGISSNIPSNNYYRTNYDFAGWYAYRHSDASWWCEDSNHDTSDTNYYGEWCTEDMLLQDRYVKDKFVGNGAAIATVSPMHHDIIDFYARWYEISGISVTTLPKTSYIQGYENELSFAGGKVTISYVNQGQLVNNLSNSKFTIDSTSFDSTSIGEYTIYVYYNNFHSTYTVEVVSKQIESIEVLSNPSKLTYIQNYDNLDLTGGVIRVSYNDESHDDIPMTNGEVNVSGYDKTRLGPQTITLGYMGKSTSLNVNVEEVNVKSVEVSKMPNKLYYLQNQDNLDLTGGLLKVNYNNGSSDEVSMKNESVVVSNFNNSSLGKRNIVLSYYGKTVSFDINIVDKLVNSIEVSKLPYKTNYVQNSESFDPTGGLLKVTYTDNTSSYENIDGNNVSISGFDNSQIGKNTVTITYQDKSTTLDVEIISKQIVGIKIGSLPDKMEYAVGEELDLSGGTIILTYNDGTTSIEPMDSGYVKVSGFNGSTDNNSIITLEYAGFTSEYVVSVGEGGSAINVPNTGKNLAIGMIIGMFVFAVGIIVYRFSLKKIK